MASCNKRLAIQVLLGIVLGVIVLAQGTLLNYYILSHFSSTNTSYFFFLGDFLCIVLFSGTLAIAYRHLAERRKRESGSEEPYSKRLASNASASRFGVLPMIYVSWGNYALLLVAKIAVIFAADIPNELNAKGFAGAELLCIGIALSGIVFFVLVEGHNWAQTGSPRYAYVNSVCARTGFEILDSVSFLTILIARLGGEPAVELTPSFDAAVIAVAAVNFFLPVLVLYKLSLGYRSRERFPLSIDVLHSLLHVSLVDVPFLCIRAYLWLRYGRSATVFLMKNVFGIVNSLRTVYPDVRACCDSDKAAASGVEYLPAEKVDECVGSDDKTSEQMDELKKINSA